MGTERSFRTSIQGRYRCVYTHLQGRRLASFLQRSFLSCSGHRSSIRNSTNCLLPRRQRVHSRRWIEVNFAERCLGLFSLVKLFFIKKKVFNSWVILGHRFSNKSRGKRKPTKFHMGMLK